MIQFAKPEPSPRLKKQSPGFMLQVARALCRAMDFFKKFYTVRIIAPQVCLQSQEYLVFPPLAIITDLGRDVEYIPVEIGLVAPVACAQVVKQQTAQDRACRSRIIHNLRHCHRLTTIELRQSVQIDQTGDDTY